MLTSKIILIMKPLKLLTVKIRIVDLEKKPLYIATVVDRSKDHCLIAGRDSFTFILGHDLC